MNILKNNNAKEVFHKTVPKETQHQEQCKEWNDPRTTISLAWVNG
jgi:hypothetical protein